MWIVTNGAFLSIVDKNCADDELLVRARRDGDIEKLFPDAKVAVGGGTDYRCRAVIKRDRVAAALSDAVNKISYPNFKSAVGRSDDPKLERVLHHVWDAFLKLAPGGRMG